MTRPTQRPAPGEDEVPEGYISGLGRDVPHPRVAHLYRGTFDEPGMAMCPKGYNRGTGYSIWRNNVHHCAARRGCAGWRKMSETKSLTLVQVVSNTRYEVTFNGGANSYKIDGISVSEKQFQIALDLDRAGSLDAIANSLGDEGTIERALTCLVEAFQADIDGSFASKLIDGER